MSRLFGVEGRRHLFTEQLSCLNQNIMLRWKSNSAGFSLYFNSYYFRLCGFESEVWNWMSLEVESKVHHRHFSLVWVCVQVLQATVFSHSSASETSIVFLNYSNFETLWFSLNFTCSGFSLWSLAFCWRHRNGKLKGKENAASHCTTTEVLWTKTRVFTAVVWSSFSSKLTLGFLLGFPSNRNHWNLLHIYDADAEVEGLKDI